MNDIIFLDDRFLPADDAKVSVKTHALQYGTGCFEGIRAYYNKDDHVLYVFRMEDHYKRLLESCKILFIRLPYSIDDLCKITIELLQKNFSPSDIYIRPFAFKSDQSVGN